MFLLLGLLFLPSLCRAMPPGSLVYRTSGAGRMYGYSGDPLIYASKGIVRNINSGHVGIYIGQENGVDYIVEALSGGIVKTPAKNFVNLAEGEKYLGAKIPQGLTAIQQAKVVAIAKSLVGKSLAYDFDFKIQKGPESGEWTCVGLTEKIYESANISNPNNLSALEYDPNYYALDITPDGFDDSSIVNPEGDCFSKDYEFSRIARRSDLLLPAPELIGFDVGLEKNGRRYIFIPYTQFLQPTLDDVTSDVIMASSFSGEEVRGRVHTAALVLRWSLINNPISSLKVIAQKTKDVLLSVKDKIFGGTSNNTTEIVFSDDKENAKSQETIAIKTGAVVNKATGDKTTSNKTTSDKATSKSNSNSSASSKEKEGSVKSGVKVNVASPITVASATKPSSAVSNETKSTSTVKMASYYNPVAAPVTSSSGSNSGGGGGSGGSGGSSSNSQAASSFPKIATINKIYSTGNNDWIELYNPTDHDFDLAAATYRIEKAKTAEDPSLIMRIGDPDDGTYPGGTIIKAHGSYLIARSGANAYYLGRAQAISNREDFAWTGSGYTLYLGTAAISSSADPDIVEAIGFGSDATYFQGSGPAPEIVDNYILNRVKSENKNSSDFNLIKSDDPGIEWATTTTEVASSTEDVATTTEDIATTTEDVATTTEDVATTTEDVATTSDEISSSSLAIINKIYSTGDNDWIELFNPTQFDLNLSLAEYRLEKVKTAEDPSLIMRIGNPLDGLYPGGTTIKAQDSYLIVRDDANNFYKSQADAIATRTDFLWTGSDYSLYLGKGPISSSTDSEIVDLVGFGPGASYWQGNGPAPAILDNYVLSRLTRSGNNNLDFNLIKSNDPGIDWTINPTGTGTSTQIYTFSPTAYDLFPQPLTINSSGLNYLWHFSECGGNQAAPVIGTSNLNAGSERWLAGKFDCAQEAGLNYEKIQTTLNTPLDINNFSISFWFRSTQISPRLSLTLANANGDSINVTLEQGLMQFSGLPNPDWRYYQNFPFDNVWRQATLVVNRNAGYWSLYIDGVEKFHIDSYQLFPNMNLLEIGGNNGPYAIDELAIWSRALSPAEVMEIRSAEKQFSPIVLRTPQKIPELKHFWNFNEGIGTTSVDLVGDNDLTINQTAWLNLDLTNSALVSSWGKEVRVNFPPLESTDLSLTFWWRSPDTTTGNRARVALHSYGNDGILSLIPSQFTSGYKFDNFYSYFDYGSNLAIPLDTNWHHLALVYDSYRYLLRFYVDGVEKGSRNFLWSLNRPLADALDIISENGVIEIDDIGVWEGALSLRQIQEILANN